MTELNRKRPANVLEAPAVPLGDAARGEDSRTRVSLAERGIEPIPRTLRWGCRALSRLLFRRATLTLADQAVVSGTSLLTSILIGRVCGASELGVYALGSTVIVLTSVFHESLISSPFTVLGNRYDPPRRAEFATAMLRLHVWLTLAVMLCLAGIAAVLGRVSGSETWRILAWTLCLVVPGTLLREFSRRLAYAHLHVPVALGVDMLTTAVQLGILGALVLGGRMSSAAGLLAIGAACALAGLCGLAVQRRSFARYAPEARRDIHEGVRFGRWIFASRVIAILNMNIIYWLLALRLGESATGVFAACLSITLFVNPVLLGIGSLIGPQAAVSYAQDRHAGLRHVVYRTTWLLGGVMLVICSATALMGEWLMALMFGNGQYAGNGMTITLLAVHVFVGALCIGFYHGLCTLRRTDLNFALSMVSLVLTALLAYPLVSHLGLPGAALALLIGNAASTALHAVYFFQIVRREEPCH